MVSVLCAELCVERREGGHHIRRWTCLEAERATLTQPVVQLGGIASATCKENCVWSSVLGAEYERRLGRL